jgi:hypothetical protein
MFQQELALVIYVLGGVRPSESRQKQIFMVQKHTIELRLNSHDAGDIDRGMGILDRVVRPSMCDEVLDFIESLAFSDNPACRVAAYLVIIKVLRKLGFIESLLLSGCPKSIEIASTVLHKISKNLEHPLQADALEILKGGERRIPPLYEAYRFADEGDQPSILSQLKQKAGDPLVQASAPASLFPSVDSGLAALGAPVRHLSAAYLSVPGEQDDIHFDFD